MLQQVMTFRATALGSLLVLMPLQPGFAGGTGNHHHVEEAGHHKHDVWVEPPAQYQGRQTDAWNNKVRAESGKALYLENCASCHGADGKGTGELAASLSHAPADLTNHFHNAPGDGDAYLFWRISEGGVVEPFKSMASAMPPFKGSLNEQQRWDVLIYIHQAFHGGFKNTGHDKEHDETGHPHTGHAH